MKEFIWHDHYKTGDATVDAQHQHLFELANLIVETNDSQETTRLLMLFYQHLREHFHSEENLMKQHGYPDYPNHVKSHNEMLDRLNEISEIIQSRQWQLSEIQIFVSRWVLVHILEKDIPLGDFLKQHSKFAG